jgi:class 3 adenylate cyclase
VEHREQVTSVTRSTGVLAGGDNHGVTGSGTRRGDEMRPITALFADIVGSTGLGERLGPDEVKALVGECVSRTAMAAQRP